MSAPRPRRSAAEIVLWTVWRVLRVSLSAALICHWLFPSFVELVDRLGLSGRWTYVLFTNAVHTLLYFPVNFAYLLMERIPIFAQFKINRKPSQQPSAEVPCRPSGLVFLSFHTTIIQHRPSHSHPLTHPTSTSPLNPYS
jgi:hypothetical protein